MRLAPPRIDYNNAILRSKQERQEKDSMFILDETGV